MFGFSLWIRLGIVGAIVTALVASHAFAYRAGAKSERQVALTRSVDILRQRNETDAEIRNMDRAELCAALGGRLSDDGTCE